MAVFGVSQLLRSGKVLIGMRSYRSVILFDAAIGYRFPEGSPLGVVELQLNAVNLFNKDYIAALGFRSVLRQDDVA